MKRDNTIIIDGNLINPYFILDVVETDSEQFITKAFKKKAKMWHPDKISKEDSKNPKKVSKIKQYFKIIVESYEFIINKIASGNYHIREDITVLKNDNISTKDDFNNEFQKLHVTTPNDYGYKNDRMENIKEYENFNFKPYQLFNTKEFNKDDFNKAFEYQQQTFGQNKELSLYHTTNDGFNPYNGGDLNGMACVSSYNGIMIVGDTFGQTGIGYNDVSYSDYKQTFESPKNPESKLNIPQSFLPTNKNMEKLSNSDAKIQIELQSKNRKINPERTNKNNNFKIQQELLLEKQKTEMKNKIEKDKELILQYQTMFNNDIIQSAFDNKLLTSYDYTFF